MGALTSKLYSFQARPWEFKKEKGIDIYEGKDNIFEIRGLKVLVLKFFSIFFIKMVLKNWVNSLKRKLFLRRRINAGIPIIPFFFPPKIISPTIYLDKLLKEYSLNKKEYDSDLKKKWKYFERNVYYLSLNRIERIAINWIVFPESFEQMMNEVPHLLLTSRIENSRAYLLSGGTTVMNPQNCKLGDLYILSKGKKYEVKSFSFLNESKINDLIRQYSQNNFQENKIYFQISYGNKMNPFVIDEFSDKLIKTLKISSDQISFFSKVELVERVGDISTLFREIYNISYDDFLREQFETRKRVLTRLHDFSDRKDHKRFFHDVLLGLTNSEQIKDVSVLRILRRMRSIKYSTKEAPMKSDSSGENGTETDSSSGGDE